MVKRQRLTSTVRSLTVMVSAFTLTGCGSGSTGQAVANSQVTSARPAANNVEPTRSPSSAATALASGGTVSLSNFKCPVTQAQVDAAFSQLGAMSVNPEAGADACGWVDSAGQFGSQGFSVAISVAGDQTLSDIRRTLESASPPPCSDNHIVSQSYAPGAFSTFCGSGQAGGESSLIVYLPTDSPQVAELVSIMVGDGFPHDEQILTGIANKLLA